ncbi:uncharacterized protein LOC100568720 isoform X1 [Acyrthosiphon pisum]|uniref:Uncharacterized protein n=1 Tax=Acyrthosiphon pisum TaxID=7029 RepID=A0A8R2JT49_ACYPI|nr:uncharacterized protein LOC100568720 isoform X1 [Acyrthosiphon pisum]
MAYFQHYWMEVVGAHQFSVHRLTHRTNNFIESYHASLLRQMGQHPALYVFYNHLRGIEQQSRIDFSRAIDGLPVRRRTSSMYTRNMSILSEAWQHVENGRYTLLEFQRRTAHTAEQILSNEIGEPIFNEGCTKVFIHESEASGFEYYSIGHFDYFTYESFVPAEI